VVLVSNFESYKEIIYVILKDLYIFLKAPELSKKYIYI